MNPLHHLPGKNIPPVLILTVSIFTGLYWLAGNILDVYAFTFTSVLFEICWLPMVLLLFITPLVALFYWIKSNFKLTSIHLLSLTIAVLVLIGVITK